MTRLLLSLLALAWPCAAWAGPPFLTDDPEPVETGHWEIYAPLFEADGRGSEIDAAGTIEVNYGALPDVQLTLAVPLAAAHDEQGWRSGLGDLAVSVKYRFWKDERRGLQLAVFPGMTLPTAGKTLGAGRVTALLPVWVQKDSGPWSLFGGGGYALNPGTGNRDYWTGGIAITRQLGTRLLLGLEADRRGPDRVGGAGATSLGLGMIYQLRAPFRLLVSGGPTIEDGTGKAGYHAFLALGLDY